MPALEWDFLTNDTESGALLLDCRSEQAYAASTLKGALGAGLFKKPYGSGPKSAARLAALLSTVKKVVEDGQKERIVCFDEGQGMYAHRAAWLLRQHGLKNVRIYAGKFADLGTDQLSPGNTQLEIPEAEGTPPGDDENEGLVSATYLHKNLTRVQLLDVRTPEEFEGRLPRMLSPDPGGLCGRIPGSKNWDWRVLYDQDGALKSRAGMMSDIRRIGLIQERPTVLYDYNGARSCTTAMVLSHCGYRHISVYLGSWMEWRQTNLPKQHVRVWNP